MSDANLRGANFRESALRSVEFDDADLTDADLEALTFAARTYPGDSRANGFEQNESGQSEMDGIRDLNGTNVFA